MAKRLTEADIRRVFREEDEWKQKRSEIPEETKRVAERFNKLGLSMKPGTDQGQYTAKVCDIDLLLVVQQVIDAYWEVVEDECNE